MLFGIAFVATVLIWRRKRRVPRAIRRQRPLVTGRGDLFRLLGSLARGALFLVFGFLLAARVLFWPGGRRW